MWDIMASYNVTNLLWPFANSTHNKQCVIVKEVFEKKFTFNRDNVASTTKPLKNLWRHLNENYHRIKPLLKKKCISSF